MKYFFSKLIFVPITLIIFSSIVYVGFSEKLIGFEDNHIKMFMKENLTCVSGMCEYTLFNGSFLKLNPGESVVLHNYNQTKINMVNYGSLILLLFGLLINHYFFNNDYDFKKELKDLNNKLNDEKK